MNKLLVLWVLSFISVNSYALEIEKWLPNGAQVLVADQLVPGSSNQIVMSAAKRINNTMHIDKSIHESGASFTRVLEVNNGASLGQLRDFYADLIKKHGASEYSCQKRDCGINSYWATKLFNNAKLKGRDSEQYYQVGRVSINGSDYYVSVYLVKNYLRKNVVHLQFISIKSGNVQSEVSVSQSVNGAVILKGELLVEEDNELRGEVLNRLSDAKSINIVAYSNNERLLTETEMQVIRSKLAGLVNAVRENTGKETQIETTIVGPLNLESRKGVWYRVFAY